MIGARNVAIVLPVWALVACATRSPEQTLNSKADYEFNRIVRAYEIPAREATNDTERAALLNEAIRAHRALVDTYPKVRPWAAKSLLAIADLYAMRGESDRAVEVYEQVALRYPDEDWEVIKAWRAAGDIYWRTREYHKALSKYFDLVRRFDRPGLSPEFSAHVRHARDRIREAEIANSR